MCQINEHSSPRLLVPQSATMVRLHKVICGPMFSYNLMIEIIKVFQFIHVDVDLIVEHT